MPFRDSYGRVAETEHRNAEIETRAAIQLVILARVVREFVAKLARRRSALRGSHALPPTLPGSGRWSSGGGVGSASTDVRAASLPASEPLVAGDAERWWPSAPLWPGSPSRRAKSALPHCRRRIIFGTSGTRVPRGLVTWEREELARVPSSHHSIGVTSILRATNVAVPRSSRMSVRFPIGQKLDAPFARA